MRSRFLLLLLGAMAAAMAVVQMRHESRLKFAELQALHTERDALNIEWGQLLLEEGAWSQHRRVEAMARAQLGMDAPDTKRVAVIRLQNGAGP